MQSCEEGLQNLQSYDCLREGEPVQGGCIEMIVEFMSNYCDDQGTSNDVSRPKGLKRKSVSIEDRGTKQGHCIDYVLNGIIKITSIRICLRDVGSRIQGADPWNLGTGSPKA